jgi:hypothetical protein
MSALDEIIEAVNPDEYPNAIIAARSELAAYRARIAELEAALETCIMFLSNTNTISDEAQARLVSQLVAAGRQDLADSVALGGFAALLGDER